MMSRITTKSQLPTTMAYCFGFFPIGALPSLAAVQESSSSESSSSEKRRRKKKKAEADRVGAVRVWRRRFWLGNFQILGERFWELFRIFWLGLGNVEGILRFWLDRS